MQKPTTPAHIIAAVDTLLDAVSDTIVTALLAQMKPKPRPTTASTAATPRQVQGKRAG